MMRRILHIDIDAFFVSVEQTLDPALRGRSVVVGGDPNSRGVVACASYEARVYGLKAGMSLAVAQRLCPHAIFLGGNFYHYRNASARFLGILSEFTPDVEPLGLEEAFLDLTGFEPIYGPVRETALRIKGRIRGELELTASVGIAGSKVVAKVASDLSKPDGLVEVAPGEERNFLAPLPVAKLPCVGPKTERMLQRIGITTIGELGRLPISFLRHIFGVHGDVIHRYANGIDNRGLELPAPAKSISRESTFAEDTLDRTFLSATLHYLGERVGATLRSQGRQARCVTLKLRYADFESITRSRTLREGIDTDRAIFEVGRRLMEKALEQRAMPVRLVGIGVSNLIEGRQLNMFDPWAERQERLNEAIDRIRGKYGFVAVEVGRTLPLREVFPVENGRYCLETPSLSR
ncbi:MAG: DNA polymerase IV [Dehalococcoidia bacterium]